jgi:hypothetical protein
VTVYNFTQVLVWDNLGGSVKVARNQRVNVTDPSTGAVAPGLTVSGQPVSFVTSDSNGHVSFAATIGTVTLTGPNGFSMNVQSPDAYVEATQAAADAASSASSAAASAQSAQDSANLVGAPAKSAMDAAMGGDVANLVPIVGDKVAKGDLFVNVKEYGATGDGTTLDHAAINNAITAGAGRTVYLPAGTYLIDAVSPNGIQLNQPGTRLLLDAGATIKVQPNSATNYIAVKVTAADCIIEGGKILGDVGSHTGTTGEWGHLIQIDTGGDRCTVQNVTLTKAWGDGIAIQGGPDGVTLRNVLSDDNRRQGLSVISASRLRVYGGQFSNTGKTAYTAPGCGIDIEPNVAADLSYDLEFHGVTVIGNKGSGVQIIAVSGSTTQHGVKFFGGRIANNQQAGIAFPNNTGTPEDALIEGVTCSGNTSHGLTVDGNVTRLRILGGRFVKNGSRGISIVPASTRAATNVAIIGAVVMDNSQTTTGSVDGIRVDGAVTGAKFAYVRSGGTSQRYGLSSNSTVSQASYIDCDLSGNTTGTAIYGDAVASRIVIDSSGTLSVGTQVYINNTKVLGVRRTGWAAPTGTASRAAFDTTTATTATLAQALKALIDDLTAHGVIGP